MSNKAILQGKDAVILGAGGSIGAAVAKEFAAEGARVFLAGRTKASFPSWTPWVRIPSPAPCFQ